MNVLKAIGKGLLTVVGIVTNTSSLWQPLVKAAAPAIADSSVFTGVISIVASIEAYFANAYGPDAKLGTAKLAAAKPMVIELLRSSQLVAGHTVKDPALLERAATGYITATVDLLNSLAHTATENAAMATSPDYTDAATAGGGD